MDDHGHKLDHHACNGKKNIKISRQKQYMLWKTTLLIFLTTPVLGRGDFEKKSQKVPAFWKMGAVTVIRLSSYIVIPSCTPLTCRCFSLGVENAKQHLLTLVSK